MVELQKKTPKRRGAADSAPNNNPYASLDVNRLALPGELPSLDQKDKAKMGKSMQRRISVHYTDGPQIRGLTAAGGASGSQAPSLPKELLDQYQQENLNQPTQAQSQSAPKFNPYEGMVVEQHVSPYEQPGAPSQLQSRQHSVDSIPLQQKKATVGRPAAATNRQRGVMDLQDPRVYQLLSDPSFDAETFISTRLGDATATDIEKFNTQLNNLNAKVQSDIKSTSLQTYERLKSASKELSSATTELKFLRNAISELSDITNQMKESAEKRVQLELEHQAELTKSKSKRIQNSRVKDRSSIIVLERMWATQMSSLFKHVEGVQKYIAAIPGRHIIAESGRWYELNAATFKTLQPAHLFLLNDLILIATRKRKTQKKQVENKSQMLVADQCWPLREVQLSEVTPPTGQGQAQHYAINIKYNSLSYVYQTDRLDHYRKIIDGYKKARDELRDIMEAESLKQKQLRDSLNMLSLSENSGNGAGSVPGTPSRMSYHQNRNSQLILQDLSTRMHSRSRSTDNSSTLRTLKKTDDQVDEIDVLIFHEKYDEALDRLADSEQVLVGAKTSCSKEEMMLYNVVQLKISSKRDAVSKELIDTMRQSDVDVTTMESCVLCLLKLGQKDVAKTLFLNNRSRYIESLVSRVTEEKDLEGKTRIADYVTAISIVKFQNIKTAIELYKGIFRGHHQSLSYLIDWALSEVREHFDSLKQRLHNVKLKKQHLETSILLIHRQVLTLKDSGLDVEYLADAFYKSIDTE